MFDSICKVNDWWGNAEGETTKTGDEFVYRVGTTWVRFRIAEIIPAKRIVWQTVDCDLPWLQDRKEWNGTSVAFDISPVTEGAQLNMTHHGLTPEKECYENCKLGWNHFAGNSLKSLITTGVGMLDKPKEKQ